jgi:hypothetical protein
MTSNNNIEGITTSLTPAKTKSISLRTTVPMHIVRQFGLTADDKLSWKLKVENGELIIVVKPIKSEP